LWFGTWTGGLSWLGPGSGRFVSFGPDVAATSGLRDGSIQAMRAEEPSTVWLGTRDGLYRFDVTTSRPEPLAGTAGLPVAGLRRSDGSVWLGTPGGGLLRMQLDDPSNPASARFRGFTRADGLAADAIGMITEARDGRLWLSTTRGISSFDPQSGRFENYDSG